MLVCVFSHSLAHETAGAARTRHSLLPLSWREKFIQRLGRNARRGREVMAAVVLAHGASRKCDRLRRISGAAMPTCLPYGKIRRRRPIATAAGANSAQKEQRNITMTTLKTIIVAALISTLPAAGAFAQ